MTDTYRRQLDELVAEMTVANHEQEIADSIDRGSCLGVKMFVDGNLDKRLDKLQGSLEFVAESFEDMDPLFIEYIKEVRQPAYDSVPMDCERFFGWLKENHELTPVQCDYIACQSARHKVEFIAAENRSKHIRFQEVYSMVDRFLPELATNSDLSIVLNPIRVWGEFATNEFVDDDVDLPVRVLFFPVGDEIATAVLELEGQALINELADYAPISLQQWAALTSAGDPNELQSTAEDLADMGLVAIE